MCIGWSNSRRDRAQQDSDSRWRKEIADGMKTGPGGTGGKKPRAAPWLCLVAAFVTLQHSALGLKCKPLDIQ